MAQYFSADIDFSALINLVLTELKEPLNTGSEAVPLDYVKDKINETYFEIFNDQRLSQSVRETSVTFNVTPDAQLVADADEGDTIIFLNDVDGFLPAANVLLLGELKGYSSVNSGLNTLNGVDPLSVKHYSGELARQAYPLSTLAPSIDGTQIQLIQINGLPVTFLPYDQLIGITNYTAYSYTVYEDNLIFAIGGGSGGNFGNDNQLLNCFMSFTQTVSMLSDPTSKPSFIPNRYRIPLLVYGAATKIAASDSFRTSWDWWKNEYDKNLALFIAEKNKRVLDHSNRVRPTVYGSGLNGYRWGINRFY